MRLQRDDVFFLIVIIGLMLLYVAIKWVGTHEVINHCHPTDVGRACTYKWVWNKP